MKEWTPEMYGGGSSNGTAMMSDLIYLAEDDLRKGHLRRAEGYEDGKLVVESEGEGEGESESEGEGEDELTTEEKEAMEDSQRRELEEREEERSMKIDTLTVDSARSKVARNEEEEEERSEMIVKTQENEMSTLEKKLDDKKAIVANRNE